MRQKRDLKITPTYIKTPPRGRPNRQKANNNILATFATRAWTSAAVPYAPPMLTPPPRLQQKFRKALKTDKSAGNLLIPPQRGRFSLGPLQSLLRRENHLQPVAACAISHKHPASHQSLDGVRCPQRSQALRVYTRSRRVQYSGKLYRGRRRLF